MRAMNALKSYWGGLKTQKETDVSLQRYISNLILVWKRRSADPMTGPMSLRHTHADVLPLELCQACLKSIKATPPSECAWWLVGLGALTFHWIAVIGCRGNTDWTEYRALMSVSDSQDSRDCACVRVSVFCRGLITSDWEEQLVLFILAAKIKFRHVQLNLEQSQGIIGEHERARLFE